MGQIEGIRPLGGDEVLRASGARRTWMRFRGESGLGMSVMHKLKSPIYSAVGKRYEALPVHGLGVVGWECGWRDPEKS